MRRREDGCTSSPATSPRAARSGDGAGAAAARLRRADALVEQHHARGEPVYIVSATLQEIVDAIAADLGFDGALGTVFEVKDGRYTGQRRAVAAR